MHEATHDFFDGSHFTFTHLVDSFVIERKRYSTRNQSKH